MATAYLLFFYRIAAILHYAVLTIIVGAIKTNYVLLLMVSLMALLAGVLTLIPSMVNPPAPPYSVSLLFRQIRVRLGLPQTMTNIEEMLISNKVERVTHLNWPRSV